MSTSSIKGSLVIFDLDGTLYDTRSSFPGAVKEFLTLYQKPLPNSDFLEGFIGEPPQVWEEWIASLGINSPLIQQKAEFDRLELEAVKKSGRLYTGADQVVTALAASGLTLSLCSNGRRVYVKTVLDKFNLTDYFKIIKVPLSLTDTKVVMTADIRSTINPQTVYLMGDRKHDLEAAMVNGFIFIGAAYGFAPSEIKEADYIIQDVREAVDVILSLCNS